VTAWLNVPADVTLADWIAIAMTTAGIAWVVVRWVLWQADRDARGHRRRKERAFLQWMRARR